MLSRWNAVGGPFEDGLDGPLDDVVSSSPVTRLERPGSTLPADDVLAEVAALPRRPGGDLVVTGAGQLVRSLHRHTERGALHASCVSPDAASGETRTLAA